jgi:hypothetical protein
MKLYYAISFLISRYILGLHKPLTGPQIIKRLHEVA